VQLPFEDTDRLFKTMVNWGRTADLFDYDSDTEELFEDVEEKPAEPPAAPAG